jgi:PTH1 family peptidyl-tRNA hydrolase
MQLIVGLGNPGRKYRDSPHNLGANVCEEFARLYRFATPVFQFESKLHIGTAFGKQIAVLQPQTSMNLSGHAVAEALDSLAITADKMILIFDDIELNAGKLRLRPAGGHGGHNGVRSVIQCIGTEQFPRIRIGIGRPENRTELVDYLLSEMGHAYKELLQHTMHLAVRALEMTLEDGLNAAMNHFNRLPPGIEA